MSILCQNYLLQPQYETHITEVEVHMIKIMDNKRITVLILQTI